MPGSVSDLFTVELVGTKITSSHKENAKLVVQYFKIPAEEETHFWYKADHSSAALTNHVQQTTGATLAQRQKPLYAVKLKVWIKIITVK